MFIGALWVLEQEQKFFEAHFTQTKHPLDTRAGTLVVGATMVGAIAQTGFIGGMPYRSLIGLVGREDAFLRKLTLHSPRSSGGKGVPIGFSFRPFGPKFMRASAGRKFAAKAVGRFVPGLGWVLFAADMWMVGKWIGNKTKHLVEKPPGSTPGLIDS